MRHGNQLKIRNLSWSVGQADGRRWILKDVALDIGETTWVHLVGPNGSGKTTLLSLLSGRRVATKGQAYLSDGSQVKLSQLIKNHRISLVTQEPMDGIVPGLTVLEYFWLRRWGHEGNALAGPRSKEFRRKLESFLRQQPFLEALWLRRQDLGEELSGGWKHMLQIGASVFGRPALLLLDEALSGLAENIRSNVGRWLVDEQNDSSLIITAHGGLGKNMASRIDCVWSLNDGRISVQEAGTRHEGSVH